MTTETEFFVYCGRQLVGQPFPYCARCTRPPGDHKPVAPHVCVWGDVTCEGFVPKEEVP